MAKINELGNIIASCHGCSGSTSTFEYLYNGSQLGATSSKMQDKYGRGFQQVDLQFRLFRCAGCGMGGLGAIEMNKERASYPMRLENFGGLFLRQSEGFLYPKIHLVA